ncbi:hypothetical protein TNCV_3077971 [Trichonephila clavipes]|nr:hypothetical protein TNCV_3077971 [Trichonephila clavipes]
MLHTFNQILLIDADVLLRGTLITLKNIGARPRNSEPRSRDENNILPCTPSFNYHTKGRTLSLDSIGPLYTAAM